MPGRFLTLLSSNEIPGKADYHVITAVLSYWSDVLGVQVDVPIGFVSDFASVPRVPVAFEIFGGDIGDDPAAVVHDYLYGLGKYPRAACDAVFREALQACGLSAWRAWAMWASVRVGGESHYTAASVDGPAVIPSAAPPAAAAPAVGRVPAPPPPPARR